MLICISTLPRPLSSLLCFLAFYIFVFFFCFFALFLFCFAKALLWSFSNSIKFTIFLIPACAHFGVSGKILAFSCLSALLGPLFSLLCFLLSLNLSVFQFCNYRLRAFPQSDVLHPFAKIVRDLLAHFGVHPGKILIYHLPSNTPKNTNFQAPKTKLHLKDKLISYKPMSLKNDLWSKFLTSLCGFPQVCTIC